MSTPFSSFSTSSFVTIPFNVTVYVLFISCFGCVILYTKFPSLDSNNAPDVYMSNLPTGTTLSFIFIKFITVSLLNWSFAVVTYPIGLFNNMYTNSSLFSIFLSSKYISSFSGLTFVPSSFIILPFTFILPSVMYSSHFLLDAIPASARYFCNLISSICSPFETTYSLSNFFNTSSKYSGIGASNFIMFPVIGCLNSKLLACNI